MTAYSKKRSGAQQGFALALTLFLLLILSTVCFGALSVATIDSRTTFEDYKASRALYAARAGLAAAQAGVARARSEMSGNDTFTTNNAHLDSTGVETYSVSVVPATNNDAREFKIWKVTSTGTYEDASRTVEAYLEIESFSKFAYFTDTELRSGTVINFGSQDKLDGHVHTNGYYTLNGTPQFSSRVTSANRGDSYFDQNTYSYVQGGRYGGTRSWDPADFYHASNNDYDEYKFTPLDESPDFSFSGGQTAIPMPENTEDAATVARAEGTYFEGPHRVTFNENGTASLYKGQIYYYNRQPYVSYPDQPTQTIDTKVIPGVTMYFDDEVEVHGTVKGRVTLAVHEDIRIAGDIVYKDEKVDVLGMLSEQGDIIVNTGRYSANNDRYIHSVMMALHGSFYVQNYNQSSIGKNGQLHVFGGIIQQARGPVGTSANGGKSMSTGYKKDYIYDRKLQLKPPLNFPKTSRLVLRYFIDKGSLGGV